MNAFSRRLIGALVPVLVLAGCGGGGGGGDGFAFTVTAVNPSVSTDLGGGDVVTIFGTNFLTVGVASVSFGGMPATDPQVLSETEMTVKTPAAPGGVPGTVTVTLTSLHGGAKQLTGAYTYASSGPNPQAIAPTIFTPTGAEDFTITGTDLGPHGGQVTVTFQGIGSVTGDVSADGKVISGRAPVTAFAPPVGPFLVTFDAGAGAVNVPGAVTYPYTGPISYPVAGQAAGNASQPVRLADGYAALCTAGGNLTWGDADDDIRIVQGPPNGIQIRNVPPRGAPGTPVGFLSQANSIPAVLGPDTFCVYTVGATGVPGFVLVTNARTAAPVADVFPSGQLNAAPIAAIGPNRIAFMTAGADLVFGPAPANLGDDLLVVDFNLAQAPPPFLVAASVPLAGIADVTPGSGNFSVPQSPDGDTVFVMGVGLNGVPGDADDTFLSLVVSTATSSPRLPAPSFLGRPIPFSPTLAAAPGAGPNRTFGNADDTLEVFSLAGAWSRTSHPLGRGLNNAVAVVPYGRAGNGIAMPVTGPTALMVFTDPLLGTNTALPFPGTPLLAPLGGGGLAIFGPGPNLVPMTGGDDQALLLDASGTGTQPFSLVPTIPQNLSPTSDADRAFTLSPGPDATFGTSDDMLEVYQSRSLAATTSASQLPVSTLPTAPATGSVPFVPVGPGWGLLQSPGINRIFGDLDDTLIVVRY